MAFRSVLKIRAQQFEHMRACPVKQAFSVCPNYVTNGSVYNKIHFKGISGGFGPKYIHRYLYFFQNKIIYNLHN